MKINRIVRSASVLAAAAILVSAAGCADTSWSYKTSNKSITNGMWIYSTYSQVSTALSKIQEETGKTVDITDDDFSSKKVEKKKVYDWIQTNAKDKCIEALTYEKLVKDNKVKIDENTIKSGEKMYESYMGGASDLYDKLGISMKSAAYLDSTVQTYKDEVFKKLYDKEGTKAVSDDEVQKYFKENYTGIVFKVAPGSGSIKVEAQTTGNMVLKVKIGEGLPITMELEGKLKVTFPYSVTEETNVYIYGGMNTAGAKPFGIKGANSSDSSLKIYSIEVDSNSTGIDGVNAEDDSSADAPVYNLNGQRVNNVSKGIYIKNGRKVLVK